MQTKNHQQKPFSKFNGWQLTATEQKHPSTRMQQGNEDSDNRTSGSSIYWCMLLLVYLLMACCVKYNIFAINNKQKLPPQQDLNKISAIIITQHRQSSYIPARHVLLLYLQQLLRVTETCQHCVELSQGDCP